MGKKVRSAKGENVDFDLLKLKEQMASATPPQDVKLRKDFIEKRLKRRLKKVNPPLPPVKIDESADVEPSVSTSEEVIEDDKITNNNDEAVLDEKTKTSRQKARPPKKT